MLHPPDQIGLDQTRQKEYQINQIRSNLVDGILGPVGGSLLRQLPLLQTYRSFAQILSFAQFTFPFSQLDDIAESLLSALQPANGQLNVDCERKLSQAGRSFTISRFCVCSIDSSSSSSQAQMRALLLLRQLACMGTIVIVYQISIRTENHWKQ